MNGEHKIIYTIFSDYVAAHDERKKCKITENRIPNHLTKKSPQFMQQKKNLTWNHIYTIYPARLL